MPRVRERDVSLRFIFRITTSGRLFDMALPVRPRGECEAMSDEIDKCDICLNKLLSEGDACKACSRYYADMFLPYGVEAEKP